MKRHVFLTPINPIFLDRPANITGLYDPLIENGSFSQPVHRKRGLCKPSVCGRCRNAHPEIADHTNNESSITSGIPPDFTKARLCVGTNPNQYYLGLCPSKYLTWVYS